MFPPWLPQPFVTPTLHTTPTRTQLSHQLINKKRKTKQQQEPTQNQWSTKPNTKPQAHVREKNQSSSKGAPHLCCDDFLMVNSKGEQATTFSNEQ